MTEIRNPLHERVSLWFYGSRSTTAWVTRLVRKHAAPRPSWLNVAAGAAFTWSAWTAHPAAGGVVFGACCLVANWRLTERSR